MLLFGLTGGIATGKSTAAKHFASKGVPVIDADRIARQVVQPGQPALRDIQLTFGDEYILPNGQLHREKMSQLVFSDATMRKKLNKCTHPHIRIEMVRQLLKNFLLCRRMVVMDIPLLFENKFQNWLHAVGVVYCPESVQKTRLMRRDSIGEQEAHSRMSSQMSIEEKKRLATVVIDNSGSLDLVYQQIDAIVLTRTPSFVNTVVYWWLLFFPALWLYFLVLGLQWVYCTTSWCKVKAKSVLGNSFIMKRE